VVFSLLAIAYPVVTTPQPQNHIAQIHQRIARSIVAKDYSDLEHLMVESFSRDFVWRKANGSRLSFLDMWDMSESENRAKKEGKPDGPTRYTTRLSNWKRSGNTITVEAHSDVVGDWLTGGRRLPVKFKNMVRERWRLEESTWKAVQFNEVWIRGSIDGKPFAMTSK